MEKNLIKEVNKMIIGVLLLSTIMVIFFGIFGYFDMKVVWGALLGSAGCILNYFFLAYSISQVVKKDGSVKGYMGTSYTLRMMFIAALIIAAIKLPHFNYLATIIPFIFPKIVIMAMNIKQKNKNESERRIET